MTVERVHVVSGNGAALDSITRDEKVTLLREHGAVLLRGFAVDTEEFRKLAIELGCNFYNMTLDPKVRKIVSNDGMIAGVIEGNRAMPMHMERGYSPLRPELAFFHVLQPSPVGGESLLCSGARVLDIMRPSLVDHLRTKRLKYRHTWEPEAWRGRYGNTKEDVARLFSRHPGVVEFHFDGDLLRYTFVAPGIVKSRLGGREGFCNNLIGQWLVGNGPEELRPPAAHDHTVCFEDDEVISPELWEEVTATVRTATEIHPIEPKDVVMIDNYRFMHGREAFEGTRVMHTIMADARM
jgi:alpha-ketoglutarate-dependent taurine dioxygenase